MKYRRHDHQAADQRVGEYANAQPKPIIFTTGDGFVTNTKKTLLMITAADKITLPVFVKPMMID